MGIGDGVDEAVRGFLVLRQVVERTSRVIAEAAIGLHRQQRAGGQGDLGPHVVGRTIHRVDGLDRQAVARVGIGVVGQHASFRRHLQQGVFVGIVSVVDGDRGIIFRSDDDRYRGRFRFVLAVFGDVREGVGAVEVCVGGVPERAIFIQQ